MKTSPCEIYASGGGGLLVVPKTHHTCYVFINPLIATLKAQSNGPSHSNTVIGTLAVDGWAVTFGTARRGLGGLWPRPAPNPLLAVQNVREIHQWPVYQLRIIRCGTIMPLESKGLIINSPFRSRLEHENEAV